MRWVEWARMMAVVLAVRMVETTAETMVDLARSTADKKAASMAALKALKLADLRVDLLVEWAHSMAEQTVAWLGHRKADLTAERARSTVGSSEAPLESSWDVLWGPAAAE